MILLLLLTASCSFTPYWAGAETGAGEFVWRGTPDVRFYINLGTIGVLFLTLIILHVQGIRKGEVKQEATNGCLFYIFLVTGIPLFFNLLTIWSAETFSINSERIERTRSYIWRTEKESVEWKDIDECHQLTVKESVWKTRVGAGGGAKWEEGKRIRIIRLFKNEPIKGKIKKMEFVLDSQTFGRGLGHIFDLILGGSEDFTVSPDEERRLKTVIYKYLPEKAKKEMSPETKEYFSKQD